ncbi:hypothetical protein [Nitrosopumilus sp.]|uniref:hypothetical protein n=1 Tax=Nitrosopumilus sp. TaxID=2024843 RepID=UPI0034A07A0B
MTNDIDILCEVIEEYRQVNQLKKMNYELLSHLQGVYCWIFKYAEQNNIPLPKKEALLRMAEKADFLIDEITNRKFTGKKSTVDLTEPVWGFCQIYG